MSKAILKALGDELIARGGDRMTVRRALNSVTEEEAAEAFADVLQWAEEVVDGAVVQEDAGEEDVAA